ncbi:Beta-lactamase/transpeptidase-like protein [Mycena indigotica]|uniref:Beta-lactamase/transpeptidase-like protein n=1 Tax=Mycena indigotica TaxID=2126181 RepID=A0A8H6WEX2_9AGAR|nr:Beta-lactamase/transpeptidase-like protein [Mycena indigotica]KAF7316154.1 Beta-lactamase/transpeptidase-like protein [Mycena indigotica]
MSSTHKSVKPPACDSCKAKRVLCHAQTDGKPCPRCVEKKILCKTTYVPRGRPRKPTPTETSETSSVALIPASSSRVTGLLTNPDLVKHLFKCVTKLPFHTHPLFRELDLEKTVAAASWRLDLLQPHAFVLAHCICAIAATIAFHPDILGVDIDLPNSLFDPKHFYLGADLRPYGARRAQACRLLHEAAIRVAGDARIHLETSEYNTLSCFILDSLEEDVESSSRPWAASYMSHVRTLMASWPDTLPNRGHWSGYIMGEALRAVMHRKPVTITYADQLWVLQGPPPSLESVLESSQKELATLKHPAYFCFRCIEPCTENSPSLRYDNSRDGLVLFHTITLCRNFYEKISGDFARRRPLSELALRDTLETLTTMHALITFCFAKVDFPDPLSLRQAPELLRTANRPETSAHVRICASGMCLILVGLVITVHNELEKRDNEARLSSTSTVNGISSSTAEEQPSSRPGPSPWSSARIAFLRSQARDLALSVLPDLRRVLTLQEFAIYGYAGRIANLLRWAEFCLQEADQRGGILGVGMAIGDHGAADTAQTYERIFFELKGIGFSHAGPQLDMLIERMEVHLAMFRGSRPSETMESSSRMTFEEHMAPFSSDTDVAMMPPEMTFLLDGLWLVPGFQVEI